MSYSEYYLINRQLDIAYNPPKLTPADSRLVSGTVHEKDQTILSIIMDMNFQPKVVPFDKNDEKMADACEIFTAKIKKALELDGFRDKLEDMIRILISQGNVFTTVKREDKFSVSKTKVNSNIKDRSQIKWKTSYEKEYSYTCTTLLPNTAVFPINIMELSKTRQPRIYYVMHYPTAIAAQVFKDNPRWESVPKTPTRTIPVNTDGIWSDYYLQLPVKDFIEVIVMESEMYNEYQVWLNGVQMLPVQEENGLITGFPLSEISGENMFTLCKGDYERIPFFFFSKSNPSKNEVKEEQLNEVMRLMVLFLRQKANPPMGNNTNRILPQNLFDPGMIIPDIKKEDLSLLVQNNGISQSEFSFYQMLQNSISDSSVSSSVEGLQSQEGTATQYLDQKKENLKKLGLSFDRTMDYLKQVYWAVLINEIHCIDQKSKQYSSDGKFIEAYRSFNAPGTVDGKKGTVAVNLTDDVSEIDPYDIYEQEQKSATPTKILHATPTALKDIIKRIRDNAKIEVVAEPEGEQVALLGSLFNLLTQYANLKGGDTRKVNFDYLETIIAENSGFDANKIWLSEDEVQEEQQEQQAQLLKQQMAQQGMQQPAPGAPAPSMIPQNMNTPTPPQNSILANAR